MDFCANLGRFIVAFINVIFMIVALLLLAAGCILKFGWDGLLKDRVEPLLDGMLKAVSDAGYSSIDLKDLNIGDLLSNVAIPLIVTGAIFFFIAVLGCCGACCKMKYLLLVYIVILVVLLLAQIIFVIILFQTDAVTSKIKEPFLNGIKNDYTGFNGTSIMSLGLNFLMLTFECCGVNDYKDFNDATKWEKSYHVPYINEYKTLKAPVACCKLNGTFPNIKPPNNYNCTFHPTTENSNFEKGCYQSILDILQQHVGIVIGVGVGILLFQLILIVFSILIYLGIRKESKIGPV